MTRLQQRLISASGGCVSGCLAAHGLWAPAIAFFIFAMMIACEFEE